MKTRGFIHLLVVLFLMGCDSRSHQPMGQQGARPSNQPWGQNGPKEPRHYKLPATDMPAEVRASLHPWVAGFVGLSPEEATKRLHERWAGIKRPSLMALRETLSKFEVREIVDFGFDGSIYAERPGANINVVGNSFFLPGPMDAAELESRLQAVSLEKNNALREFLTYFAGLAEDETTSGHFVYLDEPWEQFTDSWKGSIAGFDAWKGSLMLYHDRGGCHVLVHPTGKVGWWVMPEHLTRDQAKDVDEFVLQFNERRKIAWPFDPYDVPADER